jgi:hypothetical protein
LYFDLFPRKITINELNSAYPGMVDSLVQHEGIGFVVGYEDDGQPAVFGKNGARNLHTGDVVGEDPLIPFGDVELRAWQVRRIADFPNAGDLILNSTLYEDGTVAAMEELIGSHGGLGGEQTDAFIFHPGDMEIPETRNSHDFMEVLKSRVGLPGATPKPEVPVAPEVNPWAFSTLGSGIAQVGKWVEYAVQAITLNRETYRMVARDAYMTGPALLIMLISQILQSLNSGRGFDLVNILVRIGVWIFAVVFLYGATIVLRGKGNYAATFRVAGFAQAAHILEVLGFIPIVGDLVRFIALVLSFFGVWIGASEAHDIHGWRTFLIPVIFIVILVVTFGFLISVIEGTFFTVDGLLYDIGVVPEL